jgi:hypothetical protein
MHNFDFSKNKEFNINYDDLKKEFPIICNKLEKVFNYYYSSVHTYPEYILPNHILHSALSHKEVLKIELILAAIFESKYPYKLRLNCNGYYCTNYHR